ncbi:peptidoglycan-binding protein [Kitasatospora sp. NPDC096077]|uniref:peptidoglycan-binding protein n=1 Tax=Kitasatospora sp. NPDC096077 TaxID=3155544 RepID=UPI00331ABE6E
MSWSLSRRPERRPGAHRGLPLLTAALLTVGFATAQTAVAAPPPAPAASGASGASGNWVTWDGSKLSYASDAQGNRVPDYSFAGYAGGGVPLPQVATKVTVPPPSGGDDTAAVQSAIDQAGALPLDADGFRGAVQLSAGQYQLAGTLSMGVSGVVLRGATADSADTSLVATGATSRTLIQLGSTSANYTVVGSAQNVTDSYVPVGGTVLTLADAGGFAVGDQVVVERPTTQAWIDAMGMTSYWSPNWSLRSERTVKAVNGNRITIDAPLTTALESQYTQATVYHYTYPRINHVGIENLSADGQAMTADPDYATDFYNSSLSEVNAVEDGWITNVFTHHFGQNGVTGLNSQSRRISVVHTGALDMVVNTATSARSDGYTLQGQENLIQDCRLSGTKVHAFETEARQSGPNVYSDCTATSTQTSFDSGGHQRWGGGTLYDDVSIAGGSLNMLNYGSQGTGHGWGDGNSTAWNCNVGSYTIMSPPTAHNWAIGCTGTLGSGSTGEIQNPGANVLPQSLYNEQLAERLGSTTPPPADAGQQLLGVQVSAPTLVFINRTTGETVRRPLS